MYSCFSISLALIDGWGLAYVVVLVLREYREKGPHEQDELVSHVTQLMHIAVCVHVAEASSHGVVDEEHICEFVP